MREGHAAIVAAHFSRDRGTKKTCDSDTAHKTEAVVISSRQKVEAVTIKIGEATTTSRPSLKYLGVMIDHRLSFKEHLAYASGKASKTAAAISRIMANTRGPRQPGRRLLVSAVTSTLMYAAPIWPRATKNGSYMQDGDSVQGLCALRVCSAFRRGRNCRIPTEKVQRTHHC